MSVTVTLDLNLKPEAVEPFCTQLKEALVDTRKFPGFVDIYIHRHADDPARIILIEQWETRAAYDGYVAFRTEGGMAAAMAEILTQPPTLNIWDHRVA